MIFKCFPRKKLGQKASQGSAKAIDHQTMADRADEHSPEDEEGSAMSEERSDFDDETSDFVRTNPMMERIRSTLHQQLLQTRDRVKLELLEQEQALKGAKRAREDAGIELYGSQQQLSRLQANLTSVDERYDAVSKERVDSQAKVAKAKKQYAETAQRAEELRKEETQSREDLDVLLGKVRQAKKYNDAMKSEVSATRTAANKTKDDLKARAKSKLDQDVYIDGLNVQVTRLEDEIALTDAQLRAQKEQSAEADDMIRETSAALDQLASEQKRLVQQWNSSVVALGRRDQALSAATRALRKVQDSIRDLENENIRLERDIRVLQESNESTKVSNDRLDNEIVFIENNTTKVRSNLAALSEKFEMLQEALKQTGQEEAAVASATSKIETEISSVNHKCELLIRERHKIEEKISTMRQDQTSMSKIAQNLAKEEKSVLAQIHDKEIESATILNEIARLDIDRLNTQAHNSQLKDKLQEELVTLKEAEATIDKKEIEIRQCHNEIEKKTTRVAKLNRDYNKIVEERDGEEPLGPLEATIKALSAEIEQETNEIQSLQKEWLLRQTDLIKTISKTNSIQEKDSASIARLDILRQKQLRLVQEIHTNEASLKSIEYKSRGLHSDMTRLNDLIEQNARRKADYENKIAVDAMEFERERSELDQQSAALENQIAEVQANRRKMLEEIEDFENELTAWEKKIQVEKETQEELHTCKDTLLVKGMEKEIQHMKRRLGSLVQTQEQLLRDMELAIHKREDIAVKHTSTKCVGRGGRQTVTKGELDKKVKQERSKLGRLEAQIQEVTASVSSAREELEALRLVLSNTAAKHEASAHTRISLEEEATESEFEKNRLLSMCGLHEELLKRYETLERGDVPAVSVSARTEFEVERALVSGRSKMEKLSDIITGLAMKFDQYEDIFDRMNLLATTDLAGA